MTSVFECKTYKDYLNGVENDRKAFRKGFRSRLAEVLNCQNAYISHVLNSQANFSLEQGLQIGNFLKLTQPESRYFLTLIEHARAGTEDLRNFFSQELLRLKEKHFDLKERIVESKILSAELLGIYHSSWVYSAVHILVTIPEMQTIAKIANALSLSRKIVEEVISFLVSSEILVEKNGTFSSGTTTLHLGADSPHICRHHVNWRLAAIQNLERAGVQNQIHYSTVSSLSRKDVELLKSRFVKVIEDYVAVVRPSKEEVLYNFNLDFYSLNGE